MNLPHRRKFLHLAAGAAGRLADRAGASVSVAAGAYRRWICLGRRADICARLIAQSLSERLGQSFVIDNRPGVGSNVAVEAVVNVAPDGYTLLIVGPAQAVNAPLYDKLNFNFIRDIARRDPS